MVFKLLFIATAMSLMTSIEGAKIIIYPIDSGFNSRLMNLVKIADILNTNGHNATAIINNRVARLLEPQSTKLLIYDVPNVENLPLISDQEVIDKIKEFSVWNPDEFLDSWINVMKPFCNIVLGTDFLYGLKAEGYDLVIFDSLWECGKILVEYLDIPSIAYSNYGFSFDPYNFYPTMPSFICYPGSETCTSDKMDFGHRVGHFIEAIYISRVMMPKVSDKFNKEFRVKYNLNASTPYHALKSHRSPIIVNGDFVLDYPRPTMPHVLMIPGLFHKVSKALPEELESFIEGSGGHGVIVVSFGSMISKVDEGKAEIFAKVFGELPQRVIWRHTGTPKSLKKNTKLVSWFPQSDVLRHPLVKLFVTHCGISGTYEAAMNGLPVVAIPLFADQLYNSYKLVERGGMGVRLRLDDITETSFRAAVTDALINDTYLENAQHVSRLLKDEEMPAQQKLLYWVNYTIHHQGAKHLISETALGMNSFVFYSVDVVLFLLLVAVVLLALIVSIMYCSVKFFIRLLTKNEKMKKY